jgi:hypothetical protein
MRPTADTERLDNVSRRAALTNAIRLFTDMAIIVAGVTWASGKNAPGAKNAGT